MKCSLIHFTEFRATYGARFLVKLLRLYEVYYNENHYNRENKNNMGKVVCHMSKSKAGSSGGLTRHIDRNQKNVSGNIDESRTHLNFELAEVSGTIDEMIKSRISEGYKGTKAIRKDAVTSQRYILSGSHDEMSKLDETEIKKWAVDNYEYFARIYGEKNIIRASVHLDETTPHMHLIVVPLTQDGRLSAKEFTGDKKKLKQLQTDYAEKIGSKYGLERGVEDSNRKHITTRDYYRYVNDNELTADKLLENENKKELIGKLIELADSDRENLNHIAHKKHLDELRKNQERDSLKRQEERRKESEKSRKNRGISR